MPDELELCYLPASEAMTAFRAGEVSPVEVLEAQIERAGSVEPVVNAFTDTFFDSAIEQARAAADRYATGSARPLEGLTLAIKDEMPVAGQRNTDFFLAGDSGAVGLADHDQDLADLPVFLRGFLAVFTALFLRLAALPAPRVLRVPARAFPPLFLTPGLDAWRPATGV